MPVGGNWNQLEAAIKKLSDEKSTLLEDKNFPDLKALLTNIKERRMHADIEKAFAYIEVVYSRCIVTPLISSLSSYMLLT